MFFIDKRAHSLCFLPHLVSSEVLCAAGIRGAGEEGQRLCPRLPGVVEGGKHTCDGSQERDCASQVVGRRHARRHGVGNQPCLGVGTDIGSDQMLVNTLRQDFAKLGSKHSQRNAGNIYTDYPCPG